MGRTIAPVRYEIRARLDELERFASALRDHDRRDFEVLRAAVERRIGALGYAQPLDPVALMQWCVLLELIGQLRRVRDDLDRRDLA